VSGALLRQLLPLDDSSSGGEWLKAATHVAEPLPT